MRESLARLFLQRYGIVWRDLVMREALAPSWRELLYVYRRMEARGEIRGGRFVAGFVGSPSMKRPTGPNSPTQAGTRCWRG